MPRRLAPEESALWKKVAATVTPLPKAPSPLAPAAPPTVAPPKPPLPSAAPRAAVPTRNSASLVPPRRSLSAATLDGHWDRRLRKGLVRPDMSIDLHGHTLASAQARLDDAIHRALLRGARVLLVVGGLLMVYGLYLGVFHSGVEWGWWPGPTDCTNVAGPVDTGGKGVLDALDKFVPPSCDKAALRILGLSLAGWNAIASLILAAVAFRGAFKRT